MKQDPATRKRNKNVTPRLKVWVGAPIFDKEMKEGGRRG
jgi:hypothetical protein